MNTEQAMDLQVDISQTSPMPLRGSFSCAPGQMLALVGPSGAGKTSMLRVLAGLLHPENARVSVGSDIWCNTAQGLHMPRARSPTTPPREVDHNLYHKPR